MMAKLFLMLTLLVTGVELDPIDWGGTCQPEPGCQPYQWIQIIQWIMEKVQEGGTTTSTTSITDFFKPEQPMTSQNKTMTQTKKSKHWMKEEEDTLNSLRIYRLLQEKE